MKKIIALILIGFVFTACQKETIEPTETERIITNTVTVHDTIKVIATDIIGSWTCYQIENQIDGGGSFNLTNWKFYFTPDSLFQDLDNNGSFEHAYKVVYGNNHFEIYYPNTSPITYILKIIGNEYKVTKLIGSNQAQIWYLRK